MNILIVDDHTYNRDLLKFILEDDGHDCLEAEDGVIAIKSFKEDLSIDLILMDINMPNMDGITATKSIKSESEERFVPIIFVTALDDPEITAKCLEAGGDDFVPKPVNENVLLAKVKAHGRSQALYNKLKVVNSELTYHKKLMDRENLVVEQIFAGSNRATTNCSNIKKYTSPASMFNGDLVLVSPSPSGGAYVLVGDFTGHGLAASIGSLPVTEIFFSLAARHVSIGRIVSEINARLNSLLPSNMFFCATMVYMDRSGRVLTIWSGGMNDLLVLSNAGELKPIEACHMPLGILTEDEFDEEVSIIDIEEGTKFYIYTDGVNEAQNSEFEEFGLDRLRQVILEGGDNVVSNIKEAVYHFLEGSDQQDDVSIVELTSGEVVHTDKTTNEVVDVCQEYHNADSFPWVLSMKLQNQDLKHTGLTNQIMDFVGSIKGIDIHQDKIYTIVSELFSNALEHGILELESSLKESADGFESYYRLRAERLESIEDAYINVDLSYERGDVNKIHLVITNSGKGFDYDAFKKNMESNDGVHGRGIHLLNSLCASIEYSNGGKTVTAVYELLRDD